MRIIPFIILLPIMAFSSGNIKVDQYLKEFHNNLSDKDKAMVILDRAYQVAISTLDSQAIATIIDYRGWVNFSNNQYEESITQYRKALKIVRKIGLSEREAVILNHLANSYFNLGKLDSALFNHHLSLDIRLKLGNMAKAATTYNNLGAIYVYNGDIENAEKNFEKSLNIFKQEGDFLNLIKTSSNLLAIYLDKGNFDLVKLKAHELLSNIKERKESIDYSEVYFNLGMAEFNDKQYDSASESFLEATHIARNQENYFIMSLAQTALGKIHVMKGRYKSALSYLMEGELAAKKNNTIFSLSRSYKAYIDYYKAINSFDQALAYQERLMELNEQLSEGTKISSIENIYQKIFEKENQNLLLEKQAVLQKNSWVTTTTGILSSMFIFILVGGWKRLRLIKKDRVKIEKHYHELTKSNALLQKDVSVRTTQLKEVNQTLDNFIYRTSHDIRGPLATLKGLSQTAQMEEMDVLAKEYFKKFNKMTHNLDDVLTRLQDASMIKHKQLSFETVNICEIVNNCIESNNTKSQYEEIKVEKEFNGQCEIISDKGLVHVSIEQLIDNAYKFFDFSQGKEPYIRIETAYKNKGINVKIIDNGIGIPKDSLEKIFNLFERASDRTGTGGIGLYLVKQALDRIGGTIGVKSSPGERFTEFEVFFPSHA